MSVGPDVVPGGILNPYIIPRAERRELRRGYDALPGAV
jgi:hypothetical protein